MHNRESKRPKGLPEPELIASLPKALAAESI